MKVLVAHPGLQYSHQLAQALYESGGLLAFWSGVPLRNPAETWDFFNQFSFVRATPIPRRFRRHQLLFPLMRRLVVERLLPASARVASAHRLDHLYDRLVARRIGALRPDVVVAYENSALHTFKAAKAIGATCVLDAASVHHLEATEFLSDVKLGDPGWVMDQKDQEVALADAIITCSMLAAQTYQRAGTPIDKLYPCPLGTDLPQIERRAAAVKGKVRFIFVGSIGYRKAVDVILDCFQTINADEVRAELTLVGGVVNSEIVERAVSIGGVKTMSFVSQTELFSMVAQHDCLILPSRVESFGMVVPEAMAVGVPAIVSDRVGAKSVIEAHPGSGWIVPFGRDGLLKQIESLVARPEQIERASIAAKSAAGDFSWPAYHKRVVSILEKVHKARQG